MTRRPLCVAILWHMHQPEYGDSRTGEIHLPWTRFHATKDYYDMAALAAEVPGARVTINIVPSLIDQLELYGAGRASETYANLTLRDAAELDPRERAFLLRRFFQLPWHSMLGPYPRYRELLDLRGPTDETGEHPAGLAAYTVQDYRDLQAWYNLSWCGRELRRRPEIARLLRKGRDFTEEDKRSVVETQFRFTAEILPYYARLQRDGAIEVTVSPYYHPILPLLCDTRSARDMVPDLPLPSTAFAHPGDALEQIERARQRYRRIFGVLPAGMWPSEGSVSDAALELARQSGIGWLATDDGVLFHSLRRAGRLTERLTAAQKFCAYRWRSGPVLFFRDHGLSDLIGFTYSRWRPEDAAADLLDKIRAIAEHLPDDGRHYVVPIILDGENAWEHYPDNGAEFLRRFYTGLADDPRLRPVTFSEFLDLEPHREPLETLAAGSWIGSSFTTWIGHREKNLAWEYLAEARSFLATASASGRADAAAATEMLIAEGSDWFWWYGDDHPSENAGEFDALFRSHVKNVYRLCGAPHPRSLDVPISQVDRWRGHRKPLRQATPRIDGIVTDADEWVAAGYAVATGGMGAMHRSERALDAVYFAYDTRRFYLRIDLVGGIAALEEGSSVALHVAAPRDRTLRLERRDGGWVIRWLGAAAPEAPPEVAADSIVEIGIPLETLGVERAGELRFAVALEDGERVMERFPASDFLALQIDLPAQPSGRDSDR